MLSSGESVTDWIGGLKAGEADAAQRLWDRYRTRLVRIARTKFGNSPRLSGDEDDLAHCAFVSLWRGAIGGRWNDIKDRDELWWILTVITHNKVVDHVRHELAAKRGGGHVVREHALVFSLADLINAEPTPDFFVALSDQFQHFYNLLHTEDLRDITTMRLQGYSSKEIGNHFGVSKRTIDRKLRSVRETWIDAYE